MAQAKKKAASNSAKKAPAAKKKSTAKEAPAKATAKKTTTKKTATKKAATKTSSATKTAAAKKSTAKKSAAKKTATKKTTAKKATPKKAKSPFDKKFLDAQRALLNAEREKYLKSAITLQAEADSLVESREPGDVQFDEESGEGDTLAVERERDLALSAHARAAVDEIDAALARIDNGAYGICVMSGLQIPKERLKAIPWAAERVEYKAGGLGRR